MEIIFNYVIHIERIYKKLGMFLTDNQHKMILMTSKNRDLFQKSVPTDSVLPYDAMMCLS